MPHFYVFENEFSEMCKQSYAGCFLEITAYVAITGVNKVGWWRERYLVHLNGTARNLFLRHNNLMVLCALVKAQHELESEAEVVTF